MSPTDTQALGLRFLPSQARKLRALARLNQGEDASLYDSAADATEHGEPLIVFCSGKEEVERMAHGFTTKGIERPVIEELNG